MIVKKTILYIIVAVIATTGFLYFLFPKEALEDYIDYQIYQLNPDFSLSFGALQLYYPPYVKVSDAIMYHLQKPVVTVSSAKIRLGRAIFLKNGTIVAFKGGIREGRFWGNIGHKGDSAQGARSFEINLDGIQLEEIDGIRNIPNLSVSGRVDGNIIHVDKNAEPDQGQIDLIFKDCTFQLANAPFDIKNLRFNRIDMGLIIVGQTLKINRLEMTGTQVNARFDGQVDLKHPIQRTELNLKGNVRLHAEFMALLKKKIPAPLWPNKKSFKNGLPITVSGTVDNPRLGMR